MKNLTVLFVAWASLFTAGCATAPTPEQQRDAYYGRYPDNYKTIVQDYMNRYLKDPSSATYDFSAIPMKGWVGGSPLTGPIAYGYRICAAINAKNSFGGYTGAKRYFFLILDDQVVRMEDAAFFTEKACP